MVPKEKFMQLICYKYYVEETKKTRRGKNGNRNEKNLTSSSPSILYMMAAGVFIDGSPSGRPTTARKCCSYCEV